MKHSHKLFAAAAAALLALSSAPAHAAVKTGATVAIMLSDGDSTPSATTVVPGATFTVTATLATSTPLTGVDYYLQTTGAASGKFRILDRNIGNSPLADPVKSDTGVTGSPGVEDASVSLLNPRNGLDLGAGVANVFAPLPAGAYSLATYTISVPANTAPGTYVLSTTSDAGTGWVETAPLFDEYSLNAQGSFSVTVAGTVSAPVPEPTALAGWALAATTALLRRRPRR